MRRYRLDEVWLRVRTSVSDVNDKGDPSVSDNVLCEIGGVRDTMLEAGPGIH